LGPLRVLAWGALAVITLTIVGALGALVGRLPLEVLVQSLGEEETLFALGLSLRTSLVALAVALGLGVPAAWLLARVAFPGKVLVETVLDLPMVTPPLVAGMGLLFLLGRDGPVVGVLGPLDLGLLFSPAGVVLAQAYIATSVVVRGAKAAFQGVNQDYAGQAATLGLSPGWVFLLVEVPLAGRGLLAAAILGWARALGEFGATLMVAGATRLRTETLPMAVFLNIASGETEVAIACAVVLLSFAFCLLLFIRALAGRRAARRHPRRLARAAP
jgi:molybdate transport system permease protein